MECTDRTYCRLRLWAGLYWRRPVPQRVGELSTSFFSSKGVFAVPQRFQKEEQRVPVKRRVRMVRAGEQERP